jgi:hypothetical protein
MSASPEKRINVPSSSAENLGDTRLQQTLLRSRAKASDALRLPERYVVKTNDSERVLTSLEAPNLNVHVEARMVFSASVARKSPPGTIFLDGVAQGEPFMDHERQVYNLDHHEGCVRSFTLAACEQALVMYMKGLDLQNREWNIFANEPDLDTLLAIWIILNHARIGRLDPNQRRLLFALVRYEGVVDAMGLELKELSALPVDLMSKIQRVIDRLRSDEVALKREGDWQNVDYLAYTAATLHKIDQIFYKTSDFADYHGVEELARIDLTDQRIAAVVEADMGIYEIEPHLNKLYSNRLGIVFLKKGARTYTVRQMDLFMPISLDEVYDRLNFADPSVKGRTATNKWGGAADIGGSPRESGTQLSPFEMVHACRAAVHKINWQQKILRAATTTALIGFIVLCAHIVRLLWEPAVWLDSPAVEAFWNRASFGFVVTLLTATAISLIFIARSHPWQFGWTLPIGKHWWLLLPVAMAGGVAGGVWAPTEWVRSEQWSIVMIIGVVGLPFAAEMLFRSLAHGLLSQTAKIQRFETRWFLSWPVIGSTLLYVGFVWAFLSIHSPPPFDLSRTLLTLGGAALLAVATGMVRERAQSILPAVLFHSIAAASAFLTIFFTI